MKLVVEVEVLGNTGVAWRMKSDTIEGEDAKDMFTLINERIETAKMISLPERGGMVFLTRPMLDRAIVRIRVDEA